MSSRTSTGAAGMSGKKRKVTEAQVDKGLDTLVDSTTSKDIDYICTFLNGKPELASFVSSLLRDGDLQKSLDAKKEKLRTASLGKKLPPCCKKFKLLSKTFCEEFVKEIIDRELVEEGQDPLPAEVWRRILCFGLRVTGDVQLPRTHFCPEYEGSLKAVLHERARQVNMADRLADVVPANAMNYGNYAFMVNPKMILCRFSNEQITLPFPDDYFDGENTWTITGNDSIFEAMVCCEETGTQQKLWQIYSSQKDPATVEVDNEWFEYPEAAAHIATAMPSTGAAGSGDVGGGGAAGAATGAATGLGGAPAGAAEMVPLPAP